MYSRTGHTHFPKIIFVCLLNFIQFGWFHIVIFRHTKLFCCWSGMWRVCFDGHFCKPVLTQSIHTSVKAKMLRWQNCSVDFVSFLVWVVKKLCRLNHGSLGWDPRFLTKWGSDIWRTQIELHKICLISLYQTRQVWKHSLWSAIKHLVLVIVSENTTGSGGLMSINLVVLL